jgi:hypothetical protein
MKIFNFFKKKRVIIRGIQRSGTNFLENLSHRLDLKVINKGDIPRNSPKHKHFRVQNDKASIFMDKQYLNEIYVDNIQDLNFLVIKKKRLKNILIIKDPINWILSINRWAKKCGWISKEKNLTDDFDLMSKYLKEWDNFHLKWLDLAKEKDQLLILQWENLITNFHDNLEKIGNFMELKNYNQNLNISDFRNINLSEDSKIQDIEKIDTELSHKIYNLIKFNDFKKIY